MEAVTNVSSSCGDREDAKTPEHRILALARTLAAVFLTGSAQLGGPGELLQPSTRCPFSGGRTAAREQPPHGSVPGLLCLLCQGRLLLPWGPRVSVHVKRFLSTDICGTGAPAPGELLEQIYF